MLIHANHFAVVLGNSLKFWRAIPLPLPRLAGVLATPSRRPVGHELSHLIFHACAKD